MLQHDWDIDERYFGTTMWKCRDCGWRVLVADDDVHSHQLHGLPIQTA
jgi:hypothetical protein